jgi:hypothetical protein
MLAATIIAVLDDRANTDYVLTRERKTNKYVCVSQHTSGSLYLNVCAMKRSLQCGTIIYKCLSFLAPLSADRRRHQGDRHDFARGQIEREVVRVAFVHDLHTKVGTVNVVGPSVDNPVFRVHRRLIKVEPVKVEGHGRHAHICQPNAEDGPQGQEKVQGARVAEVRVLEDEAAKVAVCGDNNVLRFLFLSKLVLGVSRLVFGRLANERRGHQLSVHGREQGTAEDTGHAGRVEQVHEDVVFSLEDQHETEGT